MSDPRVLRLWYDPAPIPWHRPRAGATPTATVSLIVRAVDDATGAPVDGTVASLDDENSIDQPTNAAQSVTIYKVPTQEGPPGEPTVYDNPRVQVSSAGYQTADLVLR